MPATTIDEVIARLEEIVRRSIAASDRRGYFAALYIRVTKRIRDGIRRGEFEDNARMERLDVTFAGYYFEAYDRHVRGERPSRPWQIALDACANEHLFVIHHLLLGMNAHIMLDLGMAVVDTAAGGSLAAMKGDFLHINRLLAEEIHLIETELEQIAGHVRPGLGQVLGFFDNAAGNTDERAFSLVIDAARESAWEFAGSLFGAPAPARPGLIDLHETATAAIAGSLLTGAPLLDLLSAAGRRDVAWNIRKLAEGELS